MSELKQVNVFPGRFQPFHKGHLKCCEDAYKENNLPTVIMYITNTKFDKKKPFDDELIKQELEIVKKNYPFIEKAIWLRKPFPTLICRILQEEGYEANLWLAGEDRIDSYEKMIKPEKIEELGVKVPELWKTNRYSSATEVREVIKNGDRKKFEELMPKGTEKLFDEYKEQLDKIIKENKMISLKNFIIESYNSNVTSVNESNISINTEEVMKYLEIAVDTVVNDGNYDLACKTKHLKSNTEEAQFALKIAVKLYDLKKI